MADRITRPSLSSLKSKSVTRTRGKSALAASRTGQPPAHGARRKGVGVGRLLARVGGMEKVNAVRKKAGR